MVQQLCISHWNLVYFAVSRSVLLAQVFHLEEDIDCDGNWVI
jgi:hypothetical protein